MITGGTLELTVDRAPADIQAVCRSRAWYADDRVLMLCMTVCKGERSKVGQ
jgi:hypothetical protein